MRQTKCPNCHEGVNRFLPEKIIKIHPTPWYKPMSRDIFIVCSSCRKCLQYKRGDSRMLLLILFPIIGQIQFRDPIFGYYVFFALVFYVAYAVIMHMFSDSVYIIAKKQMDAEIIVKS